MDAQTLATAMGCSLSLATAYERPFNDGLIAAQCTTVNRVAMFCAQVGTESGGLKWMEELADGSEYNNRADLGNGPTDGPRFKGRGPIQLTGRYGYAAFSQWCFANGWVPTADYFVRNPELVAQPRWGFLAAAHYWTVRRPAINGLADAGDVDAVSYAVNGGDHGIDDRRARWRRCRALGDRLLPTATEWLDMTTEDEKRTLIGAAIQTGGAQLPVPSKNDADRVLGPRTQRHTEFYNVDGNPAFAKAGKKLAYLRAMTMDLWNELVFDGYQSAVPIEDPLLDAGRFGSPVRFIIATHARVTKCYRLLLAIADKVGVDKATIDAIEQEK